MKAPPAGLPVVLERVVHLAREFTFRTKAVPTRGTSLFQLVRESGYLDFREEIDPASLRGALKHRDAIVEAWLRYSSEKEVDWGWFFERNRRRGYAVGLRSGLSLETRGEIEDRWEACALFIKHEVEAIAGAPPAPSRKGMAP